MHCDPSSAVHQDVKPEDMLFDSRNALKLADLGSAAWLHEGRSVEGAMGTSYYVALRMPMRREMVSAGAKDLLSKMTCRDVRRRISAAQALRHSLILSGGETLDFA
ncbi:hypothetical protein EUGRSUZ_H04246 [Eucalyptus grandis]|uniref:Protein kinase domain-containing protein n=2 Tax=Eucalyptus grandis TaxID=71139 RepID=A0A059B792_EUCGR|nr:hypothetical protein EUGRSUZ_H04246 [Eucalyptus grandis]